MAKFFVSLPNNVSVAALALLFFVTFGHVQGMKCNSPLYRVAVLGGQNDCTQYTYVVRAMRAGQVCYCSSSPFPYRVSRNAETILALHHKFVNKRILWFAITAYEYCEKGSDGVFYRKSRRQIQGLASWLSMYGASIARASTACSRPIPSMSPRLRSRIARGSVLHTR